MIMTSMRVFPGLFVGRREVIQAVEVAQEQAKPADSVFVCGACEEIVLTGCDTDELRDVVVKCRCGEFNQL